MHPSICQAINNLQVISFSYRDCPRVVEPHTYGRDSKGHYALRGYQTGGRGESGGLGWKLFDADEIHGLQISEEIFSGARRGYKRGDKAFETIRCQL